MRRELSYDTACALQKRVMDVLVSDGQKLFAHGTGRTGHFWSPHFFPSAAPALNVDKKDRDMLGGWIAQDSDRYNRVARVRIQVTTALFTSAMPSRNFVFSCKNKGAAQKYRPSTSRRCADEALLSSLKCLGEHGPGRSSTA